MPRKYVNRIPLCTVFCVRRLLPAVVVFVAAAWGQIAVGQVTQEVNSTLFTSLNTEGQLDEITVTAQRRTERLVDVPIAVTSVSAAKLQRDGITSLFDLSQAVPGLRFDAAGANVEPSIRGVGTLLTGPGLKPNVPVYVDGYYVPSELATNFQLLSVSAIDVLKGPQGTLFGRSATGGAVLVQTLDPSFDPTVSARASYGSYNKSVIDLYGSTRLSETLAINIAADWERGDGYIKNINSGSHDDGAFDNWETRTKLLYKPNSILSFLLMYDHAEINDPTLIAWSAYDGLTAGSVVPGIKIATGPWDTSDGFVARNRETQNATALTANFDIGFATLSTHTQYRQDKSLQNFDSDATAAPIFYSIYTVYDDTFTQEINLASRTADKLSWVTGIYFYRNDNRYNPYIDSVKNGPKSLIFTTNNLSQSYAGYADGTYEIADHLFLTAGVRYTEDRIFEHFNLVNKAIGDAEHNFFNISPRGVLRFQLNERSNIYGSYTQGYKAGALPAGSFSTIPLQPETIKAFEIGYKYADATFRFDTSVFYYDYKDLQVSAFTGFASVNTNAAKSTIYGGDFHFVAQLFHDFTFDLAGAYTHARYDEYPNASGYVQNLMPASPAYGFFNSTAVGSTGNIFSATGNTLPRAPKYTTSAGITYSHRFAAGSITLNATDYYTTKVYFDPVNQFSQGAYTTVNASATWATSNNRWALSLYGTNITDAEYRNQVLPGSFAIKQTFGPPAQFGGSATFHF